MAGAAFFAAQTAEFRAFGPSPDLLWILAGGRVII